MKTQKNLIFIGPSGVGKTQWQRAILKSDLGFSAIEMDERIGNNPKIKHFLEDVEGEDEAEKMGNALGKPWEDPINYQQKEIQFLEAEQEEMRILAQELAKEGGPYIADLAGSAIYCKSELDLVKPLGTVVYLSAGKAQYEAMQKNFLADPKPVCWGSVLEDWKEAVKRGNAQKLLPQLYAKLLDIRHQLYEANADVILPWEFHREKINVENPEALLNEIEAKMK